MGKSSKPTIGYRHFMGLYMGESRTTDYLAAVEIGGELAWEGEFAGSGVININRPMLFGGDKKEGGIVGPLTIRQGAADQLPHPYLEAAVPGPWPAARGLCTTLFDGQVGAMNPYLKLWKKRFGGFTAGWTTPVWEPALCRIGRGKNPMHIIYQCFTDLQSGLGLSPTVIDEESFLSCAQRLVDEEFGLTLPYRRSTPIGEFIQIVCDHIGGTWAADPRTNLITFRLHRDDYNVDDLLLLDESNIVEMESFEQPLLDGSTNEVTVIGLDYRTNKDISSTYHNSANVQAQGRVVNDKRQLPGLWNLDLCARVAARETHLASSLLARIKPMVKADLWGIKRGDVRALSWKRKGWQRVPVRVIEVDEGLRTDNRIGLTLAQDISGMVQSTYIFPSDTRWTPPDDEPKPLPAQLIYEATYRDLASFMRPADLAVLPDDAGFVVALGARPSGVAYGYDLTTRVGSAEFADVGSGDFSPTGLLSADITRTETLITLTDVQGLELVAVGTEWKCGNEHGRVDAINPVSRRVTIARGCVDTIPELHTQGQRVWFTDTYAGVDTTDYMDGETVDAKLLCRTRKGTLDPALATTISTTCDQRQARPYRPANVKVNGSYAPTSLVGELTVTWANHQRLLQANQLVSWYESSTGLEPGAMVVVALYDAGTDEELYRSAGQVGTSLVFTPTTDIFQDVRLEAWAVRDGLMSRARSTCEFFYSNVPVEITTTTLPAAIVGQPYSYQMLAQGGIEPRQWTIDAATPLPAGFSMTTGGLITGATADPFAAIPVTFTVAGPPGATDTETFSLLGVELGDGLAGTTLADGPVWLCLHDGTVGPVAGNLAGSAPEDDGVYSSVSGMTAPVLGVPAIYSGGGTCWDLNNETFVDIPGQLLSSPSTAVSGYVLLRRKAVLGGIQALIDRDPESGGRRWQWRFEGGSPDVSFIQIVAGVTAGTSGAAADVDETAMLGFSYDPATGQLHQFKNGALTSSTAMPTGIDFGASFGMRIGRRMQGDSQGNYYCAATAVFRSTISEARHLAYARAALLS